MKLGDPLMWVLALMGAVWMTILTMLAPIARPIVVFWFGAILLIRATEVVRAAIDNLSAGEK